MRIIDVLTFSAVLPLLLFCSCSKAPELALFSDYITPQYLASYHVRTPDPALHCPTLGQRIYVEWNVKKENFNHPMEIRLSIHFGNRTEHTETITLLNPCGYYAYELVNESFFEKQGILAYKAELLSNDQIIHTWRHMLWTDKIIFADEG